MRMRQKCNMKNTVDTNYTGNLRDSLVHPILVSAKRIKDCPCDKSKHHPISETGALMSID